MLFTVSISCSVFNAESNAISVAALLFNPRKHYPAAFFIKCNSIFQNTTNALVPKLFFISSVLNLR